MKKNHQKNAASEPQPISRVGIVAIYDDPRATQTILELVDFLSTQGKGVLLLADQAKPASLQSFESLASDHLAEQCDLVIAVGGDGTMLHAARLVASHGVPLIGINRGQLGFLADIRPDQLTTKLNEIFAGKLISEERMMATAHLQKGKQVLTKVAFNDVVLKRIDSARMLEFDTFVNGRFLNTQAGDGLIIATPTGSTAYALASGGPIVTPGLQNLVLVPICPHTLSERPIVIDAMSEITVRLRPRPGTQAAIACDGKALDLFNAEDVLSVTRSPQTVTLWHPIDYDLYATLREKLAWGRGSLINTATDS